ncbi:MAG: hypothetical protein ACOCXM_11805 [Myxococcota bacterium]
MHATMRTPAFVVLLTLAVSLVSGCGDRGDGTPPDDAGPVDAGGTCLG